MTSISHQEQQKIWDKEHLNPHLLLPMHAQEASSGVIQFWEWLRDKQESLHGIEMGCGKGRNSIWLAQQGITMTGFDFSPVAIAEAKQRSHLAGIDKNITLLVHDAITTWPFKNESFDIAIDCFASTDIESATGRHFARDEFRRLLKPDGYLMVYTLSTEDRFHQSLLEKFSTEEKNAFLHPTTGKFEKVFDREELLDFYCDWNLIEERRIDKVATFFDKEYLCRHFWMIFQPKKQVSVQ
ncbi:MAG: methyltransferase domain-containing protein [Chthoniobacterales bacterium]|nr:methyltransferase domain-containing protein [Chthoniobacterales bacterium]